MVEMTPLPKQTDKRSLGPEVSLIDLSRRYPPDQPLTALDGPDLRALIWGALDWLGRHRETVNRLNVYPVPDGDTGSNMLLTLQSAWREIEQRGGESVGSVMGAAAKGAHQGSRGNSGVILGLILQGMHQALHDQRTLTAQGLAQALAAATERAYWGVKSSGQSPVEGTILTVCREVSEAAQRRVRESEDLRTLFAHLVAEADASVRRTPELLPVLKKAGVVDSGGMGLSYFLAGMHRVLLGPPTPARAEDGGDDSLDSKDMAADRLPKGQRSLPVVRWGFDVQFLIEKPARSLAEIQATIAKMGEHPLVEGDTSLVKVHVHVLDPGQPLTYGTQVGFVTDVVVENMDDQAQSAQIGQTGKEGAEGATTADQTLTLVNQNLAETDIGVVVVSPGRGLDALFTSLGVHAIVAGGQTMNPSTQELIQAIQALPARRVILLPNNKNILLAANQAAAQINTAPPDGNEREVVIVPSRTLPQGIAALMSFHHQTEDLAALHRAMTQALSTVHTGEITTAVRQTELDGILVQEGDIIGLDDGKLLVVGDDITRTTLDLLARMDGPEREFIAIYSGAEISADEALNLAQLVKEAYKHQDVELIYGGQPYYHYILSTE